MGLIVIESIPVHTANRICTTSSSSSPYESGASIDSTVYKTLSMRNDMKTLVARDRVGNEWDLFVDTASKKHNGVTYNNTFDQLDTYLGSLGVTNGIC